MQTPPTNFLGYVLTEQGQLLISHEPWKECDKGEGEREQGRDENKLMKGILEK